MIISVEKAKALIDFNGWSDEKIARDLLQNFYDAHGHTLEGTKIDIKKFNYSKRKSAQGRVLLAYGC